MDASPEPSLSVTSVVSAFASAVQWSLVSGIAIVMFIAGVSALSRPADERVRNVWTATLAPSWVYVTSSGFGPQLSICVSACESAPWSMVTVALCFGCNAGTETEPRRAGVGIGLSDCAHSCMSVREVNVNIGFVSSVTSPAVHAESPVFVTVALRWNPDVSVTTAVISVSAIVCVSDEPSVVSDADRVVPVVVPVASSPFAADAVAGSATAPATNATASSRPTAMRHHARMRRKGAY